MVERDPPRKPAIASHGAKVREVRIASVSPTGAIEGTIRRWVSYFGSREWDPLAWLDCGEGGPECVMGDTVRPN